MNNQQKCPVCEGAAILSAPPLPSDVWSGPVFLSVRCDECDGFRIEEGFLAHGWNDVPAADKQAIAAYLKATKGKSGWVRDIDSESWEDMARRGGEQPERAGDHSLRPPREDSTLTSS